MDLKLEIYREPYLPPCLRVTVTLPTGEAAFADISLRELGQAIACECADEND